MPVETTTTVAAVPSSDAQRSFPFVLKKIMDIPPPNILEDGDDEKDKEKLCSENDGESGGGGGSAGTGGVSASLTPAIWEKTIPYDGETFHLEYMDLDEFLLENGIPASLEEELQKNLSKEQAKGEAAVSLLSSVELDQGTEEQVTVTATESTSEVTATSSTSEVTVSESTSEVPSKVIPGNKELERATPSPVNPEDIDVQVNFQPDPTDLVLSSVPGGELFNPRKHRFTDEELKPQPMIKKAKKVFVPEEQKDDKYWQRRKKNNVAAKRSRDARRLKENQITVRAAFLERENAALRQEVTELRKDCGRCKNLLSRYQAKFGPL